MGPQTLRLLQQILASEWSSLSTRELAYRNPDVSESTVRDHLREMATRDRSLVMKLEAETREQNVPWTYYAVTEYAIDLLEKLGAYEGISVLCQMYEQMERTTDIEQIEAFEYRPTPDWL